jgi:hypothetical protein
MSNIRRRTTGDATRSRLGSDGHRAGDKIRVKVGSLAGARGRVARVNDDAVVVEIQNGDTVLLPSNGVTNYSLAARRAWKVMPKRAGRPRAEHPKKKMVSLRLDLELILRLDAAVTLGRTVNRSQAVAEGVTAYLDHLGVPSVPIRWSSVENEASRSTS